jgi:deoxyribodipyrimidine photo-lyase
MEELGLNFQQIDPRAAILFKGGESKAIERLNHYFFETNCISNYKETRNGLIGEDYSSKFSAWLALGCISPRFIYRELKNMKLNLVQMIRLIGWFLSCYGEIILDL